MSRYQDWLRAMIITQLRFVRFGQELASPNPRLSKDMASLNTSRGHVLASPNTTHGQDWASLNPSLVQDVQYLIHAMAKIWPLLIQVLAKCRQAENCLKTAENNSKSVLNRPPELLTYSLVWYRHHFIKPRESGQKLMRKSCHIAKFLECKFFTRFFLQSWFWLENQLASVNQVLAKTSHPSKTYFKNSH